MTSTTRARRIAATLTLPAVAALVAHVHAQSPSPAAAGPAFEVASIKPSPSDTRLPFARMLPGGRFSAPNVTLRELMRVAYDLDELQIDGGPGWMNSTRFEVIANTSDTATPDDVRLMVRTLLAERFKLATHTETRQLPNYSLVAAKPDGALGKQLRRSGADCAPPTPPGSVNGLPPPPPPPRPPASAGTPFPPRGVTGLRCPSMFFEGHFSARSITMDQLALRLSQMVKRPVLDRTGITGTYDLDLVFTADLQSGFPAVGVTEGTPSLFTAIQEQLGLRLAAGRGPVDVVVVDRAERPSEN